MKTSLITTAILVAILFTANASFAQDSKWEQRHPRRDQVNDRLGNQNARIHDKVEDGKMGRAEAAKLHHEDHQVGWKKGRWLHRITVILLDRSKEPSTSKKTT